MPAMDRIAFLSSCPVAVVCAWMTAPVPDRVDSANWWGLHAVWMGPANNWAIQRETTRRRTSPMTNPRTPPLGFWKATMRPKPMALAMVAGMRASASCWQTSMNRAVVVSSSKTSRSVSVVRLGRSWCRPVPGSPQSSTTGLGVGGVGLAQIAGLRVGWRCMALLVCVLGLGVVGVWLPCLVLAVLPSMPVALRTTLLGVRGAGPAAFGIQDWCGAGPLVVQALLMFRRGRLCRGCVATPLVGRPADVCATLLLARCVYPVVGGGATGATGARVSMPVWIRSLHVLLGFVRK